MLQKILATNKKWAFERKSPRGFSSDYPAICLGLFRLG